MNGSVIDGWQLVAESYTSGRRPRVAALRPGAAGFHAVSRHFRALHFATEDPDTFDQDGVVWCVNFIEANKLIPARLQRILLIAVLMLQLVAFAALGGEEPGIWTFGVAKRSAQPAAIRVTVTFTRL